MQDPSAAAASDRLSALLESLRSREAEIIEAASEETSIGDARLASGLRLIFESISQPVESDAQARTFREASTRLARQGEPAERVLAGYLSLNWAVWDRIAAMKEESPDAAVELADRLFRGLHVAVAAMADAYAEVEVELAVAHADRRRSVLEELLTTPRVNPDDRARVRRRSERYGLSPDATYRLTLVQPIGLEDDALGEAVARVERLVSAPVSHHRRQPGIQLPAVLEWRGRVLVLARADWIGVGRLRDGLTGILGESWVAVDMAQLEGFDALGSAPAEAEFAVAMASGLGRRGWIGEPATIALETTFLLDPALVRSAIEHELGPLLADERMGEELIETLEVYLASRQNIRETARRLHLASRTVAYRLERIESMLGTSLEGEGSMRLAAALLAHRVARQSVDMTPRR
ncbi:MAG: helix-turn-helix domain-containing protein [Candidatus Limnocylindrales bacterium]